VGDGEKKMAEDMKDLAGPYEILELEDRGAIALRIRQWELGRVTIYPAHKPTGKVINALRVHVPEGSKPFFPWYWDITGTTLVAQLLPHLQQPGYSEKVFVITKYGVAPKARFTLEVKPAK
jgi:hypothetical protein